jgi:hypothetical protein
MFFRWDERPSFIPIKIVGKIKPIVCIGLFNLYVYREGMKKQKILSNKQFSNLILKK